MKLLTILDEIGWLPKPFSLRMIDSATGHTTRDEVTGEIIQTPPYVMMSEKDDSNVRLDKLRSLMVEIDIPHAESDERIKEITRQYQRMRLYFREKPTKFPRIDYVEYPDPIIEKFREQEQK